MTRITCFSTLFAKKNRSKESSKAVALITGNGDFRVNPEEQFVDPCVQTVVLEGISKEKTVSSIIQEQKSQNTEGAEDDKDEGAYEGGDEHDDIFSLKRDFSGFDLQALEADKDNLSSGHDDDVSRSNEVEAEDSIPQTRINNGHISDPGLGQRSMFWGSPILKRSCSNIETKEDHKLMTSPTKSYYSSDNAHDLWTTLDGEAAYGLPDSPVSVMTSLSADRVMRKKNYSFPVLPSMNRKLCWKLFLSSHKNFHGLWISVQQRININDVSNKNGGYCSDIPGSSPCAGTRNKQKMEQPEAMTQADLWVQCYAEPSAIDKVNAWIHGQEDCQFVDYGNGDEEAAEEAFSHPTFFEVGETSRKKTTQTVQPITKEIIQGNNLLQALCSFSPVANLAGMGLKLIPAISAFSSLRSVNLSGNLIAHISSGMLPKSLHTLDLSRNQIATIDGLREFTRLRVLNLSYNKISRISYGLLNCTPMKELYLAGNKINNIEGLHRLLKLKVLDLSFNKITTAKALGQLVANHNSLLALNLLGNPIQSNVGEEQLRKSICSILPKLVYLNKKCFKPQKGRQVAINDVAKVALGGNEHWSSRKRLARRVSQLPTTISSGKGNGGSCSYRSKARCQQPKSSRN